MDLQEASQKLKVTDEEINSIRRYLGFQHTSINLLSNLEPKAYDKLKKEGWLLAENEEDLKSWINDFVNLYSAMCKNTKETGARRDLIRGTSIDRARELRETNNQFLSTSTNEEVSKRFCEYGNAALLRINIGEGVPYLNSEDYRDAGVNEHEIIIAPFTKVVQNSLSSKWNGYEYYDVSIEKGELQEKSEDEINSLTTQVISGYTQNLKDMQEYLWVNDKIESLQERLQITRDIEDKKYIREELNNLRDKSNVLWEKTTTYKNNLNGLLQGLCKEKEKEIDNARDIVKTNKEQKEKEARAQLEEAIRKNAIDGLSQKVESAVKNIGTINSDVRDTYRELAEVEAKYIQAASEFGININGPFIDSLSERVNDIKHLTANWQNELQQIQIKEDNTVEEVQKSSNEHGEQFSSINKSVQISESLGEILNLYKEQKNNNLKRDIYLRIHSLMRAEKLKLLQQKKSNIEAQKVGIFDKITGKSTVRELQMSNIDLEMESILNNPPEEKEYYSARDMLAEMYAFSISELGGNFTPELGKIFNTMKDKFGDASGKNFTLDYIKELAESKIAEKQNLPVAPKKGFRLFGKNKDQIDILQAQNTRLQSNLKNNNQKNFRGELRRTAETSAIDMFSQRLDEISNNLSENRSAQLEQTRNEGPNYEEI